MDATATERNEASRTAPSSEIDSSASSASGQSYSDSETEPEAESEPEAEPASGNESESHHHPTPDTQPDQSPASTSSSPVESDASNADKSSTSHSPEFTAPNEQATLDGETVADALEPALDNLPALRVLGQFRETYLVAESSDGLVLIDQHAADERVNYEQLRDRFAGETTTQVLASPVELDLTAGETALFEVEECKAALDQLGFDAERVDDTSVEVTSVPGIVAETAPPELLRDALAAFAAGDRADETVDEVVDELVADLACYPSITGNTSLTEGTVVDLLDTLDECENPYACPHGRPVIIEFSDTDIDARFERDYPGHPTPRRQ